MTRRRLSTDYQRHARTFLAPGVVLVTVVLYFPVLYTFFLSFTEYNGLGDPEFVGISNYIEMFQDRAFLSSTLNTLIWVVGTIIVPVGLGLVIAYATFNSRWGTVLRLPFLVPYALSGVAVGSIWGFILNEGGALTQTFTFFGLPGADSRWLTDPPLNTAMMILAAAWQGVGVNALLFTVGLQSIPREPIEAARVDGASGLRLFGWMFWPMLRPLTTVVVGLAIVGSLKTFDIVQAMTGGGPNRTSETLAITTYRDTFANSDYGLGSAVAIFLSVITVVASLFYLRRQLGVAEPRKDAR